MKKVFKRHTTFKGALKNENVSFFLNQGIEWHSEGFTALDMALEMDKYGLYPDRDIESIKSSVYGFTRTYCTEIDQKEPIYMPKKPKLYKIKSDYI
ncbi:hypothetical protein LZS85_15615 [Aliivibrio fischeri]|uniref:hypothetical protein n=1 Tax=Aliivibrio fischeri TaxID=668 RepID=UPI001F21DB46|nr:hypothetical protein [Aliivibrio fischeri]MCE7567551.1 hypothetical protein [Aliivibrio fischeri]